MNIYGIGIDLVETARIAGSIERHGDHFLNRCFTAGELAACGNHSQTNLKLAARWAAKEAVSKAFGTGIGAAMSLTEIEIINLPSGQPTVQLHGNAQSHAASLGVREIKISLTHTAHYAAAYAMVIVTGDLDST